MSTQSTLYCTVGWQFGWQFSGGRTMRRKRPVDGRIGERLAAARQARGLSQGKLAKMIGVATGTVQAYEHGRCRIAGERLEDIAAALQCDAADLLPSIPVMIIRKV